MNRFQYNYMYTYLFRKFYKLSLNCFFGRMFVDPKYIVVISVPCCRLKPHSSEIETKVYPPLKHLFPSADEAAGR